MRKSSSFWLPFAVSFVLLLVAMNRHLNIFDEGIVLVNAQLVLAGEIIHRDFYSPYGPGSYYAVAAISYLFGPEMLIARIFGIAVQAAILATFFSLLIDRTRWPFAFGLTIVCGIWVLANPQQYLYAMFPCALLSLIGAKFLLKDGLLDRSIGLIAAGACCGLAAYFRYDAGFFIAAAFAMSVAAAELARMNGLRRGVRAIVLIAAGSIAVFLPGAIAYLLTSPISAFWTDIIDYPLNYYAAMRGLPFPTPIAVMRDFGQFGIYLPLFAVAIGLPTIVKDLRDLRYDGKATVPATLLLGMLTLVLYYKGMVRVSLLHMLLSIIPSLALLGVLLDRWWNARMASRVSATAVFVLVGLSSVSAALPHAIQMWKMPYVFLGSWFAENVGLLSRTVGYEEACHAWQGTQFILVGRDDARVSRYIAMTTDPHDRIFVGLAGNDKIFVNSVALYFVANRLPGTHWAQYEPGLQNRLDIQNKMIDDLTKNDVRLVVRDSNWNGVSEPNGSAKSSGVFILDDYIASRYRAVAKAGPLEVWLRNDVAAPKLKDDISGCQLDEMS